MKAFSAEKITKSAMKASDLFEVREFDESSETVEEIAGKIGVSITEARRQCSKLVKDGKLEKVWKKGTRNPIVSYRPK